MADQLIEAQVYLDRPDGITIINNRTNPDLFWALRGAGHNFGIVTKVKMRIYDRSPATDSWTVASFTFTQDKLEQVFAVSNEWLRSPNRPVELTHFIVFMFNPAVDATKVSSTSCLSPHIY
jgi:FAD/FMN-containing dehydrogenase